MRAEMRWKRKRVKLKLVNTKKRTLKTKFE